VELTDEDWASVVDVNLSGAFRTFQAAIPALRRAGGGAMSATSSIAGVYGVVNRLSYSASKGGMNAMIRSLAAELWPEIRVNAVAPGSMPETGLSATLGPPELLKRDAPGYAAKARMQLPAGRNRTQAVAKVHLFLCSELAEYVNGEVIVADAGFSMWNGT
jgi:NAD(P)-dependent dehydrogenase (short-subunit alcohol dehydrogenase family)